ncbi:MAG: hypothetical protein V3W41_00130 [Planctomycetota bacterium]
MVNLSFDDEADNITCEGCGSEIPAFLDGCPYCDDESGEGDTLPCPSCGAEIYDTSEKCAICGAWVTMGHPKRSSSRSWGLWLILLMVVLFIAFGIL